MLCSKGTYIRSLAQDIGEKLGVGATLLELERTLAAGFKLDDCTSIESIENDTVLDYLKSAEEAVKHLKKITVSEKQATRFLNGGALDIARLYNVGNLENGEKVRVNFGCDFLGIGTVNHEKNQIDIACIIKE